MIWLICVFQYFNKIFYTGTLSLSLKFTVSNNPFLSCNFFFFQIFLKVLLEILFLKGWLVCVYIYIYINLILKIWFLICIEIPFWKYYLN